MRTDREIVQQTEQLAIKFANELGWNCPRCVPGKTQSRRAAQMWQLACTAQEELTMTDPWDALSACEESFSGQLADLPEFVTDGL